MTQAGDNAASSVIIRPANTKFASLGRLLG